MRSGGSGMESKQSTSLQTEEQYENRNKAIPIAIGTTRHKARGRKRVLMLFTIPGISNNHNELTK